MANCNVICNDQIGPLSKTNGDKAVDWPRLGLAGLPGFWMSLQKILRSMSDPSGGRPLDPYFFCATEKNKISLPTTNFAFKISLPWEHGARGSRLDQDGTRFDKADICVETCWNMLKHVETCWNVEAPKPWIKAKKKEAILGFVQTAMHPPRNIKAEATHSDTKRHASDPGHGNLGLIWIGFANGQYEMPVDSLWPLSMACLDYQGSQSRSATI